MKSFIYSFEGYFNDDTERYNNALMYVSAKSREDADNIFKDALEKDSDEELTIIAKRNISEDGIINARVEVNEMKQGNTFAFLTLGG